MERTGRRIPLGLQQEDGQVYEKIFKFLDGREGPPPNVAVISDIQKDIDDLVAWTMLAEMHRLGLIVLKGFVANFVDAKKRVRAGRGALNLLNLRDIPIAQGTEGTDNKKDLDRPMQLYEFDECPFMDRNEYYPIGRKLLHEIFDKARKNGEKLTVLAISSHRDLWQFMEAEEALVTKVMTRLVSQGGFSELENDNVRPVSDSANINFDFEAGKNAYAFCVKHKIELRAFTKHATFASTIPNGFCRDLHNDGSVIGRYIRHAQIAMDEEFYRAACDPAKRFAPFMDQLWYLKNKSTWFDEPHPEDEPYPDSEAVKPYLNKLLAYDGLAAVGAVGDDFMDALSVRLPWTQDTKVLNNARVTASGNLVVEWIEKVKGQPDVPVDLYVGHVDEEDLEKLKDLVDQRCDADGNIWKTETVKEIVNGEVVSKEERKNIIGKGVVGERTFHQNYQAAGQSRIDGPKMAQAIRALTRGSLLSVQQKLKKVEKEEPK
jgi:hypothetical protein